jgi:signal transduction histidine kinase
MLVLLYLIVRRGASIIADQSSELQRQYAEARVLATRFDELRLIADHARLNASESNELFLGQVGSDIHDGPIQLLALVVLKLTMIVRKLDNSGERLWLGVEIEKGIAITKAALEELRNIATGFSLPELAELGLEEAAHLAVSRHEDLTGETVDYFSAPLPTDIGDAVKVCAYRVIQEGLTNATKHAPGVSKSVALGAADRTLTIVIADEGSGSAQKGAVRPSRLGLAGMRNRVGALKGSLSIHSGEGVGTRVVVSLPLEDPSSPP